MQNSAPPKAKGLPLWTVLVALLVLAVIALGGLGFLLYSASSKRAELERRVQEAEMAREKAAAEHELAQTKAEINMARMRQDDLLTHARNATNQLSQLLVLVTDVNNRALALRTDDTGRKAAQSPDLVVRARRLYESDLSNLPAIPVITSKLESVRRIEQQTVKELGTAWSPDSQMMITAQNEAMWASQEQSKAKTLETLLGSLIRDANAKLGALTGDSPTLAAAIEEVNRAETVQHQQTVIAHTDEAKRKRTETVAEAEATGIVKTGEAEAEKAEALAAAEITKIREEMQAELKRMQTEMQREREKDAAEIAELKADAERQKQLQEQQAKMAAEEQKRKLEEMQAAHQQELRRRESEQKVAQAKAEVAAQQKEEEAERIQLREKASDPKVQAALAPFTTPGYWRPQGGNYPQKQPMSFTDLQSAGALAKSLDGLKRLGKVLRANSDRLRPRPTLSLQWYNKPDQREKVQQMQDYLNDLGPVLVDMGLLAP